MRKRSLYHEITIPYCHSLHIGRVDCLGGGPLFRSVRLRGETRRPKEASFLKVAGDRSRNVALIGNDLSRVHKPTAATAEVPEGALYIK